MIKISPVNSYQIKNKQQKMTAENCQTLCFSETNLNSLPHYQPLSFRGNSQYLKAKQYLDERKNELQEKGHHISIDKFDLEKLEGIQKGIKVFDGMSIKELGLVSQRLAAVLVTRGCSNNCAHCYNDAKTHIDRMSYEDFKSLTNGYKELNKRLGFNIFKEKLGDTKKVLVPFYDSDCAEIFIKDKQGNAHDIIEINKELYDVTKRQMLFDTAGWNVKHPKTVERVNNYISYYTNPENTEALESFNLSLNPFHKLNAEYVKYINNDSARAQKFRNLYTDRMSQVFFDLTPIAQTKKFHIYALANSDSTKCKDGFKKQDLQILYKEIRTKLEQKYKDDLKSPSPRFVFCEEDIKKYLDKYDKKTQLIFESIQATGRMKDLLDPDDITVKITENYRQKNLDLENILSNKKYEFIINPNGKVYYTNEKDSFLTDIQFNFENKNKETDSVGPNFHKDFVVTKEMIESFVM